MFPGIIIVTALKAKVFKMVAKAVEKIQKSGKWHRKRAVILSIHHWWLKHICTNALHPQVRKAKISQFGWIWPKMSIFVETVTFFASLRLWLTD